MHNCENERNIIDIAKDLKVNDESHKKLMSYYIFETVTTYYFSKKGEKVSYNRTGQVDKRESILDIIIKL